MRSPDKSLTAPPAAAISSNFATIILHCLSSEGPSRRFGAVTEKLVLPPTPVLNMPLMRARHGIWYDWLRSPISDFDVA
jgi:hypothetical protein